MQIINNRPLLEYFTQGSGHVLWHKRRPGDTPCSSPVAVSWLGETTVLRGASPRSQENLPTLPVPGVTGCTQRRNQGRKPSHVWGALWPFQVVRFTCVCLSVIKTEQNTTKQQVLTSVGPKKSNWVISIVSRRPEKARCGTQGITRELGDLHG
jgi:hypothetical protein